MDVFAGGAVAEDFAFLFMGPAHDTFGIELQIMWLGYAIFGYRIIGTKFAFRLIRAVYDIFKTIGFLFHKPFRTAFQIFRDNDAGSGWLSLLASGSCSFGSATG